jgi:hypothetical protein
MLLVSTKHFFTPHAPLLLLILQTAIHDLRKQKTLTRFLLPPGGQGCSKSPVRDSEEFGFSGGVRGQERAYFMLVCYLKKKYRIF